ncbi:pitrilysin family protein [Geothrix sp. PMB-07]|uniref:M16 family metallopeptidase n=1 Tax=Geothrix sp. PMB-07 TaxID=3068640 RepID=UPI00274091BB|nr:insulinase family protein [Geothrix sp. PMB-07]WLT31159.1 insulinase family protein [Geothrix sp. PMB-07]
MRALLLTCLATALSLQAQAKVQAFILPNGLRVLLLEDHEHPLVRVKLHLKVTVQDVPSGRQGLPQLALRMVSHSDAGGFKADELERFQEDAGIQLKAMAAPDGLDWQLSVRSRDQDRALGLLADRILRSLFDPGMLEEQREACWHEEEGRGVDPLLRLRQSLSQAPERRPTLTSLGTITWEDLLTFRARVFRPDHALLVLHGDLGLEQAKRLVLLSLGSWTPQETRSAPPSPDPSASEGVQQASSGKPWPLWIRVPGVGSRAQAVAPQPTETLPESAALLNLLVPGEPSLLPAWAAAEAGCLVATDDAEVDASLALPRLLARLEALRLRGFTQADLDRARTAWNAGPSLETLHPEAQMNRALQEALGRGADPDHMKALSLEQLNADLRRWFDPKNLRTGGLKKADPAKGLVAP